jgi:hypothetical protein
MISFTEFTEVLKYESDVYRFTKLSVYERWAIAQERSLILQPDNRKSYLSKKTYATCEELLKEIKETNWSRTWNTL